MVLAVIKSMFKVKDPHGRAGVDVVVVENTVNCDVLSRPHDRFLRDVAHSCKQTMRTQRMNIFGTKSECQKGKKKTKTFSWTKVWLYHSTKVLLEIFIKGKTSSGIFVSLGLKVGVNHLLRGVLAGCLSAGASSNTKETFHPQHFHYQHAARVAVIGTLTTRRCWVWI